LGQPLGITRPLAGFARHEGIAHRRAIIR
jgi:hypothetical protein